MDIGEFTTCSECDEPYPLDTHCPECRACGVMDEEYLEGEVCDDCIKVDVR